VLHENRRTRRYADAVNAALDPVAARKSERTRQRLLDIAILRFAAKGFRKTSVSEIAREAGRTPATVYNYYARKEGLFAAAVDADAAALIDKALTAVSGTVSTRERVLRFVGALVNHVDEHPLARRVLAGHEPEVVGRLLEIPSLLEVTATVAELLAEGQRTGEIRRGVDPAVLALGLETIVLSLLMGTLQAGGGDAPRQTAVLAVLDAALRPADEFVSDA